MVNADAKSPLCLYCGREARNIRRGEHIVAAAIGGRATISDFCKGRKVCAHCNNGVLSLLDTQFCLHSPLSIVACQVRDTFLRQTWDVPPGTDNLLVEGSNDIPGRSFRYYPQMIFEDSGERLLICDLEEAKPIGIDRFRREFVQYMRQAFHAFHAGDHSRLNPKLIRLNRAMRERRCRYPPRVFARCKADELKPQMSFQFQYLTVRDKTRALSTLENWNASKPFRLQEPIAGSEMPYVRSRFNVGDILRALLKLAINLLAAHCPNTPVDPRTFAHVMPTILGKVRFDERKAMRRDGFVWAADIEPIKAENDAHSFRLLHMDGHWWIYSSFFGGRLGSYVQIAGPNRERWRCADIVAPLNSKKWIITTSNILQPLRVRIEWSDHRAMMPTIDLVNPAVEMELIRV